MLLSACEDNTVSEKEIGKLVLDASLADIDQALIGLASSLARAVDKNDIQLLTLKLKLLSPSSPQVAFKALESASTSFYGTLYPSTNSVALTVLFELGIHLLLDENQICELFVRVCSSNFWEERLSSVPIIELLVKQFKPSNDILTASLLASADGGRMNCIKILVSLGADVNAVSEGQSVIERASCSELIRGDKLTWEERMNFLLDSGAKPVGSVLRFAIKYGQSVSIVSRLVEMGAPLPPCALYAACSLQTHILRGGIEQRRLSLELTKILLSYGADPYEEFGSISCLSACINNGNQESAEIIIEYQAKKTPKCSPNSSPYSTPKRKRHPL